MSDFESWKRPRVPEEFAAHQIFKEIDQTISVYESLSDLVFGQITPTRSFIGNLDSCFFDSIEGTVESIKTVLLTGRIADAYTLMRRLLEVSWLHVYVMLRFEESNDRGVGKQEEFGAMDFEKFFELLRQAAQKGIYVEEIEEWLAGDKSLPWLSRFSDVIATSPKLSQLNLLFDEDAYEQLSNRCNDHVHVNFFRNLRMNDKNLDGEHQMAQLEQFAKDLRDLLIRHLAYVFFFHPEYMASSDYVDALECGQEPVEGSQYWIAPFVQEVFDELVTPTCPDITEFIKQQSSMELA